jgi:hypothetical protein
MPRTCMGGGVPGADADACRVVRSLSAMHRGLRLFASTYKTYGLATVRYRVLEVEARVEPFENDRGYSLRVLRAGKPRTLLQVPQ